ncbi:hypothetical protein DL93DRAFT_2090010, partial [Clavulina sp. PMI_390]
MIAVIGKTLPQLEVLDLRSYWHGDKISYLQSLEYLVPEVRAFFSFVSRVPKQGAWS